MGKKKRERTERERAQGLAAVMPRARAGSASGDERPETRQYMRTNVYGPGYQGPWRGALHQAAEWLGPYTPDYVQPWVLKRMRADPQLKLGLNALRSPLFGITYDVKGGTPATRALVRKTLLESPIFHPLLRSVLNALDFGFQSHELLWKLADTTIEEDGPNGKGTPRTLPMAALLAGFVDIDPESVEPLVNDRGELVSVRVSSIPGVGPIGPTGWTEIPAEKVLHAVHEKEWGNQLGNPALTAAYNPWYWCNFLYLYKMRFAETRISPPLITYAPFELRDDEDKGEDQDGLNALDVIGEQAAALRNGSVASLPSERDEHGEQKFSIGMLQGGGGEIVQFSTAINHMQAMKLRALCIPERAFTQDTQVGSFAMVKEHVDAFLLNLEAFKRGTVLPAMNFLFERITRANFKSDPAPICVASELARAKQEAMFNLMSKALNVPLTTEEGKSYTPAMLIDFLAGFRSINVPHHQPNEVARAGPLPPAALSGGIPEVNEPVEPGRSPPDDSGTGSGDGADSPG